MSIAWFGRREYPRYSGSTAARIMLSCSRGVKFGGNDQSSRAVDVQKRLCFD